MNAIHDARVHKGGKTAKPGAIMSMRAIIAVAAMAFAQVAWAVDLVVNGKPAATIVISTESRPQRRAGNRETWDNAAAARVLVDWIRKISGAEIPIAHAAPGDGATIYIGDAAVKAGLKLDDIGSPTHEGLRILAEENRILIAGQSEAATAKAVCRLLEELGCRYFMDGPLGEVYPRSATVRVGRLDIREKPGMVCRAIWGSRWTANSLWKIWNGAGGQGMDVGHAWGRYVSQDLYATHPEYFALRNGQRRKGDWYCTSNPRLREVFAEGVIRAIEREKLASVSISPPDGVSYCQCEKCVAQDDPTSIEPSSGLVNVTDRYLDFFNDVARRVAQKHPQTLLDFYCYADYTQAPTRGVKAEKNLVAWIAPIRYCRFHAIGQDGCSTRLQLQQMLDGWGKASSQIAYRTYNYNLAECVVPFSMISVWKHDVPYLAKHGCIAINLETLAAWQIYGPHIYLSIRLAYDPQANTDAIMDDYFARFYGPAGAAMKEYWMSIDRGFAELKCHSGSFYGLHRVYTPGMLTRCAAILERAAAAAKSDRACAARVAMTAEGFGNAVQYIQLRDALNAGKVDEAVNVYRDLLARAEQQLDAGYGNHYTIEYLKRFIGTHVDALAAATRNKRIAMVLPDRMRMAYDKEDRGIQQNWAATFDDSRGREVSTFADTLDAQGLEDVKTILWYRTAVDVPQIKGKASLYFVEVDGTATVFVNGKQVGSSDKRRVSFEVDVSDALRPGRNTIAVRVDHSRITELMLGGIVRPIYLLERE